MLLAPRERDEGAEGVVPAVPVLVLLLSLPLRRRLQTSLPPLQLPLSHLQQYLESGAGQATIATGTIMDHLGIIGEEWKNLIPKVIH